jgi:hypothetical protein
MPRTCTVCTGPDRAEIDQALTQGESQRAVAGAYRRSPSSVRRHAQGHLQPRLVEAAERLQLLHHDDLVQQMRDLVTETQGVLAQAKADGEVRLVLSAAREVRETLKALALIVPEDQDHDAEDLVRGVAEMLRQHPEAGLTLASALDSLGNQAMAATVSERARRVLSVSAIRSA